MTFKRVNASMLPGRLFRFVRITTLLLGLELFSGQLLQAQRSKITKAAAPLPGQLIRASLGPARDSAQAVRIAQTVLSVDKARSRLHAVFFTSVDGGYLIKLLPQPATPGGGGLVWVESDGSVRVLRRYR